MAQIERVDTRQPRISLGLMTFGPPGSENYGTRITSLDTFKECLDYYQARGYSEIDTARTYVNGLQEAWTRKAGYQARGLSIATKRWPYSPGDHTFDNIKQALETSLCELGAIYVDIFYLHAPDRTVPFAETLEACDVMYREGKFKKLGLSNYAAWEVAEIWNIADQKGWVKPTVYQSMYNCLTRSMEEELVPCCRKYGLDILVYNVLAGGVLSGRYQNKQTPDDGGRFSQVDPVVGQMYRDRFFRDMNFEALQLIRPVVDNNKLTLLEVAFRWTIHHSALRVTNGNDGLVIGVSSIAQLATALDQVEKGPLPQEVVDVLELAWEITKVDSASYWRKDVNN